MTAQLSKRTDILKFSSRAAQTRRRSFSRSWSGGADWARVSPTEVTEKDGIVYAKYSYDDVAAAFGTTDFSKVDRFHVGAANGDIEVLSVKYIVGKSTEPVDPVDPDKPEQDPYVSYLLGRKSCAHGVRQFQL